MPDISRKSPLVSLLSSLYVCLAHGVARRLNSTIFFKKLVFFFQPRVWSPSGVDPHKIVRLGPYRSSRSVLRPEGEVDVQMRSIFLRLILVLQAWFWHPLGA